MHEEQGDLPLDELRRAWRGLEPELPAGELAEADPATRASVAWMRAAWTGLPVPEPRVPGQLRRRPALRLLGALSAAAAVLALLWAAGWQAPVQRFEEPARTQTVQPTANTGPQLAALDSGRLELRSGPVRLILLKDQRPQ
jgi:hypothetical protein